MNQQINYHYWKLFLLDAISAPITLYIAFLLRFEFAIPTYFFNIFLNWIPYFTLIQIIIFSISGMYARMWRYTSLFDLYAILRTASISVVISFVYVFFSSGPIGYPRSVLLLYFIFNTMVVIGIRLSVRVYFTHYHDSSMAKNKDRVKKLLLIGAGKTGEKITKEILTTSRDRFRLVGFVDDDPLKHGALLHGKKVFCSVKDLPNLNVQYDELLITAPSSTGDQMRNIVNVCKQTGKQYKTVPGIGELISNDDVSLARVRDVAYADLLGREEITLDTQSIKALIKGNRVLITGAGGSIGSELVRQCLSFSPAEIICIDFNEEKIYKLDQFSKTLKSRVVLKNILASITNFKELEKVYLDNQPQIVFHAAAYKHVPIQEVHPWSAVKTNLGGTKNLVELSNRFRVKKFVLVSTDKAVNPANVMGATKRAAEKLIQSYNSKSETTFMAVRFGNVLGSSGSAIPTFQKQINQGGPITVTHPEMTRYFMSIQEASQLILQCGALGKDGEIFLLEMGKPIKITQMVKDLIRLSGFEPEVDIPIVYTGLRPGEKLYEELQFLNEEKLNTNHKKIMILKSEELSIPWDIFKISIDELLIAADSLDKDKIQLYLKEILPTYTQSTFDRPINKNESNYTIKGQA